MKPITQLVGSGDGATRPAQCALGSLFAATAILFAVVVPVHASSPSVTAYAQYRFTAPQNTSSFSALRRFKVMVDDHPSPDCRIHLQALYKQNNRSATDGPPYLEDAWAQWRMAGGRLKVEQFVPPFGMERFTPDAHLDLIDRSAATGSLVPDGKLDNGKGFARDRGVQWDQTFAHNHVWWTAGVFDGYGANVRPKGIAPLLVTRVIWTPPGSSPRVHLGADFATRDSRDLDFSHALPGTAVFGYGHFTGRDTRWDLEAVLNWSAFRFRGEYVRAHFHPNSATASTISAAGFYVQGCHPISRHFEIALRYEEFAPDTGVVDKHDLAQTTIGLNWLLPDWHDKVQVNYVLPRERNGQTANNALVVQVQRFF